MTQEFSGAGGALLSPEKVLANLTSTWSKTQRYFVAMSGRLDVETIRRINAGDIKVRDGFKIHTVRLRGGTKASSQSLIRSDNKRRQGISDFNIDKLVKGVNFCVGGIIAEYAQFRSDVDLSTLDDEQFENLYAAQASYSHQRHYPNLTTSNYQQDFDRVDDQLANRIPPILQRSLLSIKVGGQLEYEAYLEEFLLDSWNATAGVKRDGALQLEKPFMIYEDVPVTMDLTYPLSNTSLPTRQIYTSASPGAPVGTVNDYVEHLLVIRFYGTEGTPIR